MQIELRGVRRTFWLGSQPLHALDGIDLDIDSAEYLSVMGPSGSGKSTLLNALGLLDRPTEGSYFLQGQDTVPMLEERRAELRSSTIGFVFQSYHLIGRLNARENVELPLVLSGIGGKERKRRSDDVMRILGILDHAHHLPNQLSGGQRQRVAIARAIVMQPSILLADEPTGNLDSRSGQDVVSLLEQLNQSGITLLVVTHDADLGARARRRLRMVDGRIVQDQTS
ncbi:MAG: putative ABC transport system ATP-binding protein [Parasphingorhabdus sp.]